MEWVKKPIEDAPRDGTRILVIGGRIHHENGGECIFENKEWQLVYFIDGHWDVDNVTRVYNPTHYCDLPPLDEKPT